jgi:hypothetical protein
MKKVDISKNNSREIVAGIAAILLILLAVWIWRAPSKKVPSELVGEWHTTDANYVDRAFGIDPVSISFTTGSGEVSTGFIKSVKEVSEGSRILYTITYTVDDKPNQVSFYYNLSNGNTISFKNQTKIIWTKKHDS